jgi:nucleoside-diphosphate-sugar epimerase
MKVLVTGSSGRVGRAVRVRLAHEHEVIGLDQAPSSTADVVAALADEAALRAALRGVDGVIHCAGLHAPHVGHHSDAAFETVNVHGTATLLRLALEAGVRRFVFTSTTALYGAAAHASDRAAWITAATPPRPATVYHRSKLAAEQVLAAAAQQHPQLAVTLLRMSRCFPEPAPLMAAYRLHRGIDVRDVAAAHALALADATPGCRTHVISGATPFRPEDAGGLLDNAAAVLARRAPALVAAFAERGWLLPRSIDRVYDSRPAMAALRWQPRHGFDEVLAELERGSLEVLPPRAQSQAQE